MVNAYHKYTMFSWKPRPIDPLIGRLSSAFHLKPKLPQKGHIYTTMVRIQIYGGAARNKIQKKNGN